MLRFGDRGDKVRYLQERLAAKGFVPGAIDGHFGRQTLRAVRQFQAANALRVDGVVGDRTWALLQAGAPTPLPTDLLARDRSEIEAVLTVTGSRRSVLDAAVNTLGWREEPDGSNGGPTVGRISEGYYPSATVARHGLPPWCALAVSYWLKEGLGVGYAQTPFGTRFGAVAQIEDWAKDTTRFTRSLVASTAPQGAIFTMDRANSGSDPATQITSGHTGLVVEDQGRTVRTIEGNTSNAVQSRIRRKSTLRGWVDWW